MNKAQFFVFGSLFDYCKAMCADLEKLHNCQFINTQTLIKNKLIWFLYKAHNSGLLNRRWRMPLRSIWYSFLFDKKRMNMSSGANHFVFFDSNPHVYDPAFLMWIRKRVPNSTLSLIFVNTMKMRNMRDITYFRSHFQRIYTTDRKDAEEYNFIHIEGIHSQVKAPCKADERYDITFVGAAKGRGDLLRRIYTVLTEAKLECRFTIVGMSDPPEGVSTQRMPYSKVLEDELASRAILEVCSQEQNGNTLRALEAIMYNKILVTNNKNVRCCRYYDPRFMIVFDSEEDLRNKTIFQIQDVDYQYKNDFSPIHILDDIEQHFMH